jgi:hypothetical protein
VTRHLAAGKLIASFETAHRLNEPSSPRLFSAIVDIFCHDRWASVGKGAERRG